MRSSGINPGFPGLSRSSGQIGHVLRTRSPLRQTRPYGLRNASLDLHALGAPPAFVLSQDQTLQRQFFVRGADQAREGPPQDRTESCQCSRTGGTGRLGRPALHRILWFDPWSPNWLRRPGVHSSDCLVALGADSAARNGHSAFDTLFSCQGAPIRRPCGPAACGEDRIGAGVTTLRHRPTCRTASRLTIAGPDDRVAAEWVVLATPNRIRSDRHRCGRSMYVWLIVPQPPSASRNGC